MSKLPRPVGCQPSMSGHTPATVRVIAPWLMGILAAVAGAAAYAVVLRRYSSFDFSIITVLTGFLVGRAIRAGAGHRASMAYQVLAVFLTYGAIAGAYLGVRATFLLYDGHALTPAALRPFHLLALPIEMAAQDRFLGVVYALALIVAWYACGREAPVRQKPEEYARLIEEP